MWCRQMLWLSFFYKILDAVLGAALAEIGDVLQMTAEGGDGTGLQAAAGDAAQVVEDGGGRQPLAVGVVGGDVVVFVEILEGRRCHLEASVVVDDGLRLVGGEPPLLLVVHENCHGETATGTGQWHPFIVFELFRVLFQSNVPIVYVMHLFP